MTELKFKEHCCVCGVEQVFDELPPSGGKCLCPNCYDKVKEEYEKKHPNYSLRRVDPPEDKKEKVQ